MAYSWLDCTLTITRTDARLLKQVSALPLKCGACVASRPVQQAAGGVFIIKVFIAVAQGILHECQIYWDRSGIPRFQEGDAPPSTSNSAALLSSNFLTTEDDMP